MVLLASRGAICAEEINMLFIGNSFTFRHDLNLLVKQVFEEGKPDLTVNTQRVVFGGMDMFHQSTYYFSQTFIEQATIDAETIRARIRTMEGFLKLDAPPEEFTRFWKVIRGRPRVPEFPRGNIERAIRNHKKLLDNNPRTKWDYVVLQSWQDVYPDLDEGYAKYATRMASIARAQGAKVILYITAPNIQNATPVTEPKEQERVDRERKLVTELANKIHPFAVAHVPLAINRIQQGGTELTFCYRNDFHPNQYAAFLTANMFYAAFFKETPEGFAFNTVTETNPKGEAPGKDPDGGDATVVFDDDTKTYLQRVAFEAVQAFDAGYTQ